MYLAKLVVATIVILLCVSSARADSYRRFFFGDDAAMTAGAGTAIMTDTGAIWYNPAGLGGNHFKKLQISGTAYGLHVRKLDKVMQTYMNGQSHVTGKSINNVNVVPSAFSVAFQLNEKVSFGFGLFQTKNDSFHLRTGQQLDVAPTTSWNAGMEYHEKDIQYTAGPALGVQISEDLKWGVANFCVYDSLDASLRLHGGFDRDNMSGLSDAMGIDSQYLKQQMVATYFTTGIQWRFSENWHTGALLRSPAIQIWRSMDASQFDATTYGNAPTAETSTTITGENVIFDYVETTDASFDAQVVVPGAVRLAIAYSPGKSWVGAEFGYQFPLEDKNHRDVFNASIGTHIHLSPKVGMGIGFFTDNDSRMAFEGVLVKPGNRLGTTAGIQLRSAELVEELAPPLSATFNRDAHKTRRRVLVTTLSITYSMQMVEYQMIGFAANADADTFLLGLGTDDATFHRLDIHLGGGFFF